MDCDICADKSPYALVKCDFCSFCACKDCYKSYFADRSTPNCMNATCLKVFTKENIQRHFGVVFVTKDMETFRRAHLVKQDKTLDLPMMTNIIPLLDRLAERIAEFRTLQSELGELCIEYRNAECSVYEARTNIKKFPSMKTIYKQEHDMLQNVQVRIRHQMQRKLDNLTNLENRINSFHTVIMNANLNEMNAPETVDADMEIGSTSNSIRRLLKCADTNCSGLFSLSNTKCMICKVEHCKRCAKHLLDGPLELPGGAGAEKHKCSPDDVGNFKYIMAETKSCPSCHMPMQRSSGCDQMMCSECKCVFDWRTGKEDRGQVIHNPLFYALSEAERARILQERQSRGINVGREARFLAGVNPDAVPPGCDANAEFDPMCIEWNSPEMRAAIAATFANQNYRADLTEMYRIITHYQTVELTNAQDDATADRHGEKGMRLHRLARLVGKKLAKVEKVSGKHPGGRVDLEYVVVENSPALSQDSYEALLMRLDTERRQSAETLQLVETFIATSKDIFR